MIVGASDRMLTSGDIEFEPLQTKIYLLSDKVVAMTAGDAAAQITIFSETHNDISNRGLVRVGEMAESWAGHFAEYRLRRNEAAILRPLGLDFKKLLARMGELPNELVLRLQGEMRMRKLDAQTIIAGVDEDGAHLYVVADPGTSICYDSIGFAAIGYGEWHARSQFMFNQYTKDWPFARTLLLTYSAKKRGEVAPGVGKTTDMFTIMGTHLEVPSSMIDKFEAIYGESRVRERESTDKALEEADQYIDELLKAVEEEAEKSETQQPIEPDESRETESPALDD
jgi:20S proteasome alpha/beta subunit